MPRYRKPCRSFVAAPGLCTALAVAGLAPLAPALAQPAYDFQIVVQEGDVVGSLPVDFLATALMNDHGDIAFSGTSGSTAAVWSLTDVLLAEGDSLGGGVTVPDFNIVNFDFNNNGEVAVTGSFASQGVFTSGGLAITAGDTIGGAAIAGAFDIDVRLGDDGTAYFIADVETAPGVFTTTVFSSSAVLAQEGDTIGGVTLTSIGSFGVPGRLGLDDADNVVFLENADFSGPQGVVSTAGFALQVGSPFPSGPLAGQNIDSLSTSLNALGVNGQGDILIQGSVGGVSGLYSQDGLVSADTDVAGPNPIYLGGADLNDNGSFISEYADINTSETGLVVDGEIVLTASDTIEGLSIFSLPFSSRLDLQDNGDFVFAAFLDDGVGGFFSAIVLATPALTADFNGDGTVDLLDFDILAQNFGTVGGASNATGDANGDGNVDLLDFDALAQEFGSSSPATAPASIPEPASAALLGLAGTMLFRGRRRR